MRKRKTSLKYDDSSKVTKVVLDTNILIEGIKDEYSYEKRVIDEVRRGNLRAFANHQTLRENRLILNQLIDSDTYRNEMEEFFAQVEPVVNRRQVRVVQDEEDNKILESAVEAGAAFLITNDADLLTLKTYNGVKILRPATFWAEYSDDESGGFWNEWTTYINSQRG
ncbi:MAG TPA: putative toxin-antitoxin system toxin component, PIN family [Patescibacteria group bacterium]|nr:putative toxin-antitoxin system toxin component, PIN family [Patescibacteria group bacterium]